MVVKNILKETEQSLSELWELLRKKENSVGLDILSFTDRDILENILSLIKGNNKKILLDEILYKNIHPRATFFRSMKKLRQTKFITVTKDNIDRRKSWVSVSKKLG
ncbi:hypothetical protein N9835_00275 [Alphaproteobacteria bacterium]|nr:hypothetical protein [Alphaproteobacteria bacterium]